MNELRFQPGTQFPTAEQFIRIDARTDKAVTAAEAVEPHVVAAAAVAAATLGALLERDMREFMDLFKFVAIDASLVANCEHYTLCVDDNVALSLVGAEWLKYHANLKVYYNDGDKDDMDALHKSHLDKDALAACFDRVFLGGEQEGLAEDEAAELPVATWRGCALHTVATQKQKKTYVRALVGALLLTDTELLLQFLERAQLL